MTDFIKFPSDTLEDYLIMLDVKTPASWGSMTAQHMIEHLMLLMELSRGEFSVSLVTPPEKVEKVKRIILVSDAPFKKDFVAPFLPAGLQPLNYFSLKEAKDKLLKEVDVYLTYWQNNPESTFVHPIFGELSVAEWHLFHSKHFTHHFTQFNLL
ncbi:MAG: hypothetical protein H7296_15455 [Bacteroidia bacterium]|nr:hypothetical protein [Bacteroidia bacterium]